MSDDDGKVDGGSAIPRRSKRVERSERFWAAEGLEERRPEWLVRFGRRVWKTIDVVIACAVYGMAYGAVTGALCGAVFGFLLVPLLGPIVTLIVGAVVGVFGGFAGGATAGLVGSLLGGRMGWFLAGVLGSVLPAMLLYVRGPAGEPEWTLFLQQVAVSNVLVGGFLGYALGHAVQRCDSAVPGVQGLAEIINRDSPTPQFVKPHTAPTEVSPSAPPDGRGDETIPARPDGLE